MLVQALAAAVNYELAVARLRAAARHNLRKAVLILLAALSGLIALAFLTAWLWSEIESEFGTRNAHLSLMGIFLLLAGILWLVVRNLDQRPAPPPLTISLPQPKVAAEEPPPAGSVLLGSLGIVALSGFFLARAVSRDLRD